MAVKEYKFKDILKEYNKKHHHDFTISSVISNAVIVHDTSSGRFLVSYMHDGGKCKSNMSDFVYYYVSHRLDSAFLKQIIMQKEEKNLGLQIVIWPPTKIRYAYLHDNYFSKGVGNLGKSCMRSKEMQKALNFYIKNNVRIVVVTDKNNKIHARALLWDNVKNTSTKKTYVYLDRVYTRSDGLLPLYNELAAKNDWISYGHISAGKAKSGLYVDNLDIKGICHLPYTDTFRYLYYKDNVVASGGMTGGIQYNDHVSLTNTGDGGYFPTLDPNRVREVLTGNYISKKDAIKVKRYNGYVLKKNIVDINGDYYSNRDTNITNTTLDGYVLKVDVVVEVFTNHTMNKHLAVYSDRYNGYVHKSNAINIDNITYHKSDSDIVSFDDKWYHISQCFINYDRKEVNNELAKYPLHLPGDFMPYWARSSMWDTNKKGGGITRKSPVIPKEQAIIAYNIVCNGQTDTLIYQEIYHTNTDKLIQLVTGEFIVNSPGNKRHLKKFNNKWYIKNKFKPPNKNQLLLFK